MNNIEINKRILRKEYIGRRNSIPNKDEKSLIIFEKLIKSCEYKNASVLALYKSLPSEVDTTELIKYSIVIGKVVALPKVVNNELKFYKINSSNDNFIKSKFGVEEPLGNNEDFISKNNIDLVIVPGLCFDKEKNRLGFGKGYYDGFLNGTDLKTIAICFQEQIINDILPVTNDDIKVQKIITDKEIYL